MRLQSGYHFRMRPRVRMSLLLLLALSCFAGRMERACGQGVDGPEPTTSLEERLAPPTEEDSAPPSVDRGPITDSVTLPPLERPEREEPSLKKRKRSLLDEIPWPDRFIGVRAGYAV